MFLSAKVEKSKILNDRNLSDMEKLRLIFDIEKNELRERDVFLYYAILAVLDKDKKPDASNYFNT